MAVMIFVNALAEVRGLPWWTSHAHAWEDRMTYVDMVFPFFLFAAGMSMPLAVTQRLKRNPSTVALCLHILSRVLGLLVLGFILANAEKADPAKMMIRGGPWALLGLLCMMLFLNVYPRWERFRPTRLFFASSGWPAPSSFWRSSAEPRTPARLLGSILPILRFSA
jgi:predicted acyltransferase